MLLPRHSRRLIIFEGPDGAGKTTAARALAHEIGAHYVHCGPFRGVRGGLPRMYVDAMLPAVLGYQDVVMDRSWISEPIYGEVFRKGDIRMPNATIRMLERLALRCQTLVAFANTTWDIVLANFLKRPQEEMLDKADQLKEVFDAYGKAWMHTSLPTVRFDYALREFDLNDFVSVMSVPHPLDVHSAGSKQGIICLVGDSFAAHKDEDHLYQWPFASFSGQGCSRWLTDHLNEADLGEELIFWINADQPHLGRELAGRGSRTIALGAEAMKKLSSAGVNYLGAVEHPQAWKRFKAGQEYPLARMIKDIAG